MGWLQRLGRGRGRRAGSLGPALHPSIDSIGPKAEAAVRAWINYVFQAAPEVVCAWEERDKATLLLFGPVDPGAGLPRSALPGYLSQGVTFKVHEGSDPGPHSERLVSAEVYGNQADGIPPPRTSPRLGSASDGLLVPVGHTSEGVLHVPLLGSTDAGPIAFSGDAAPELFASMLLHATARLGQDNLKALVFDRLQAHVNCIANVETFGAQEIDHIRLRLEEEWKRRHALFADAHVEDFATYALLADSEQQSGGEPLEAVPVLLLVVGARAAGEMGLTDPGWPYTLQNAPRTGLGILVWGEVPRATRSIIAASFDEGVAALGGPRTDVAPHSVAPVRFTPAILSLEARAEATAVLSPATSPTPGSAPLEPVAVLEAATPERDEEAPAAPVTARPTREAVVTRATGKPERAIYCLGGLRVEYKGAVVERWRHRGALQLLAFLIAFPNGRSQDAILEEIWPEGRPAKAKKGLNQLVSEVRRKLGGDPAHMPLIVVAGDRYRIDWEHMWADARAFREALAAAERADDPVRHLKEAVDLYWGDFCRDAYFAWTEDERYGLERAYVDAVLRLADTLIERDAVEEAHSIVDRALAIDPYSDALARHAIALDARRFGRAAALDRFRRFRAVLREMGVEPESETLSLISSLGLR